MNTFVISLAHSFGWFSAHATGCLHKPILTIVDVYTETIVCVWQNAKTARWFARVIHE